ncbi:DUF3108 domain-containing protein [Falsihalocynthiibacter arcticus]|uniref:DUF3108 domain-containing protein n=1 Tax=Falsihalocynthiibacter arcticus TaxID=1579316 RepID=A0A126UWZ4_9RHOB|nr:DUF3108 domain-containing protein [Falsihalocynthiibacter arcticus]AML50245.1 hypothetical protein RC74_02255 [Falsihalocynthiibacter arcticus]
MRTFNLRLIAASLGVATLLAIGGTTAQAQAENGDFKLYIGGIPAGQLTISAQNNGKAYQVAGYVRSTGLIGSLVKVSYKAQVKGAVKNGKLSPQSYAEQADTGRREQSSQLNYKNGVPQVLKLDPPRTKRDYDVNPAGQKGTLDPLSMIYSTLRNVEESNACTLNQKMFDGRRLSEIVLGAPSKNGNEISCSGVYRRLGGFSPEDMQERTDFRFTLTYGALSDGRYGVQRISSESLFGKVVIKRK